MNDPFEAIDRLILSGITPTLMYLPKRQWDSLLWQLSQKAMVISTEDPKGIYEGSFFYRNVEIRCDRDLTKDG